MKSLRAFLVSAQEIHQAYQLRQPHCRFKKEARSAGIRNPFTAFIFTTLTGSLSLQDLGDLQTLSKLYPGPLMDLNGYFNDEIANPYDEALSAVVQETIVRARQHEADGRYRDAEYLYRRAYSNEDILTDSVDHNQSEDLLPSLDCLVTVYEKLGDYPAAEKAQEMLLRRLVARNPTQFIDGQQTRAAYDYSRLLAYFQKRILDLNPDCPTYIDLFVTYRAAVLDIGLLNEALLDHGLIPLKPKEVHICTSLHIAAKENAINLARLLIENGADVNSRDRSSRIPLHLAVKYAESAMIKLLLASGTDIEAVDKLNRTPLCAALDWKSTLETVTILLDAKANMDAKDALGRTAIVIAIQNHLSEIAQLLLARGANIEGCDLSGETLLSTVVRYRIAWAIKLLVENGASLEMRNYGDRTPLDLARDLARDTTESSPQRSILYLLERLTPLCDRGTEVRSLI
ncbi:hypothetical protein IMSHALPRED_008869 [Imshaugia aleurites]|uniref:Ankyrin repeat protein n=1 Tax=Imshaugia aleurites TaxID=172621 RepID=A0A8H3FU89_9LECA|nr:hypothetical protein IMSHALPRED_008869 [Imshaugia aleurites]